jgi:uncharacterized membrane protein YfcA
LQRRNSWIAKGSTYSICRTANGILGRRMKLHQDTFFILLGSSLVLAAVLLWIKNRRAIAEENDAPHKKASTLTGIIFGAVIGLLSGMVGIGGGIFLAPILNLARWDTPKKIAATASLYILVNSVSGHCRATITLPAGINYVQVVMLAAVVLVGGQLGSRMGAIKFNQLVVLRLTAVLVFVAG